MTRKLTPAARHMAKVAATNAATIAAAQQGTMADATVYEQHLAKLYQDRSRLKNIASTQGKVALKKQLLDGYDDYVKGVLESGAGVQDEVFTTIMLWAIDAEKYTQALLMAEYVLEHELKLADRFERPPATMVAEEIATSALNKLKADKPFNLAILETAESITRKHDMHDQARAKIHLAIGKARLLGFNEEEVTPESLPSLAEAQKHITRAIELHENCGGKKDLEKVNRLLKKHADPVNPEPGTGTTTEGEKPADQPTADAPANEGDAGAADESTSLTADPAAAADANIEPGQGDSSTEETKPAIAPAVESPKAAAAPAKPGKNKKPAN